MSRAKPPRNSLAGGSQDKPPPRVPAEPETEESHRHALLSMLEDLEEDQLKIEHAAREWVATFDAILDPVFLHDADYRILRANRAYAKCAGMPVQEVIGKPYWQVYPKTSGPLASCLRAIQKAEEEEVNLATGETLRSRAFTVRDASGDYLYSVHVLEDVTEYKRTEKRIRELARFPSENPSPVFRISNDGILLYANEASAALLKKFSLVVGGKVPENWLSATTETLRTGQKQELGIECLGQVYIFTVAPTTEGSYVNFYGLDITERKKAEEALRAREQELDAIVENLPLMLFVKDAQQLRFVRFNRAGEELLGKPRASMIGKSDRDFFPPEQAEFFIAHDHETLRRGEIVDIPIEPIDTPRGRRLLHTRKVTVRGSDGQPRYLLGISEDITDRKQSEDKLAASEVLLRQFIQHAPAAIAMLDTQMCYIQTSERWMRDYRLSDRDIIGKSHYEVFPEIPRRWKDIHQRVLAGAVERCDEDAFLRADGSTDWLQWEVIPWRKPGGEIGGLIIFSQVITERKQTQAALLKNAEHLKATLTDTIGAIARTVEQRDPYTAGHQNRVSVLCVAIGSEMKLSDNRIEGLRLAALIHDIGKIYIPAEILNRPGTLTVPEFEMIKTHPQIGYDIIKDVQFPWPVAQIILQHHERLDGTGYPLGLKGEAILLEARILTVADVVEAMSSHRPYRPELGPEAALAEITAHRGTRYDPGAVDACVRLFKEKGFTLEHP